MFYFDANDPKLKDHVLALKPEPGFCIFADIVGSTDLKHRRDFPSWAALMHNTFSSLSSYLPPQARPLKSLGDGLLYFIAEGDLYGWGENSLTLYSDLYRAATEPHQPSEPVRVGVVLGAAYGLSFFKGGADYYGSDVDLAARLHGDAPSGGIAINDAFYARLMLECSTFGGVSDHPDVAALKGPLVETPKGFPGPVTYYVAGP